jgi:hypothetical protein
MPAIASCNNQPISLSGVSTLNYPSEDGSNLVGQTGSPVDTPSSGGSPAKVQVISSVLRSPQTGNLDFAFQLLTWALDAPWSPPAHFSVKWADLPNLKITYADFITNYESGFAPSAFAWGPANYEFRFTFSPAPPSTTGSRIFFVSTNATHWAPNQGALATFFHNLGAPQYPVEMILNSPIGVKSPTTGH